MNTLPLAGEVVTFVCAEFTNTADSVTRGGNIDLTSCGNFSVGGEFPKMGTSRSFLSVSCPGGTLPTAKKADDWSLDPMGVWGILEKFCQSASSIEVLFNDEHYELIGKRGGGQDFTNYVKFVDAISSSDGAACKVKINGSNFQIGDDCHAFHKETFEHQVWGSGPSSSDTKGVNKWIVLDLGGLTLPKQRSVDGNFYNNGTLNVKFNEWDGAVNYPADGSHPTYNFAKDNETGQGSLEIRTHLDGPYSWRVGFCYKNRTCP